MDKFLWQAQLEITSLTLGFEGLDLETKEMVLFALSLNCWQRKFVVELEEKVGRKISTENCLWNSI